MLKLGRRTPNLIVKTGRIRQFATPPSPSSLSPKVQSLLAEYSHSPTRALSLADLTKYGNPPLSKQNLLESAESTRKELLAGLARRVTAHGSLPFLPATNPSLASIHQLYLSAFTSLASVPEIKSLEDNDKLCDAVAHMVEEHRDNIPILAKGFQETRRYLPDSVVTSFLDRAIRNRITLRLLAEQHLSLSAASLPNLNHNSLSASLQRTPKDPRIEPSARAAALSSLAPTRVGILDLELSPRDLIATCADYVSELCEATYGVAPRYTITGSGADTTVGGIGVHLEYVMTELLKNAFRATVECHTPKAEEKDPSVFRFEDLPSAHMRREDFPDVAITLATSPGVLTIRIRDRGGGIKPENLPSVFSYAFTTVPPMPDPDMDPDSPSYELYGGSGGAGYYGGVGGGPPGGESTLKTGLGTLAGLGFGLPLSRIYASYFGGSLDLVSMYGWGTDTYTVLRTV
ncbi:alpha-ketoacid dehydrogenase kinase [Meredithblackwellia eburnea MCA 4105]